jgi:small-conductance mechanosensitive channel
MIWSIAVLLVLVLAAKGMVSAQTPEPPTPTDATPAPTATDVLEGIISTRTPEPTATPGVIQQQVEEVVEIIGLAQTTLLGLTIVNWTNLAISLFYVIVGYLIGTGLIRYILPLIVRRTQMQFDDQLLGAIAGNTRWLVVIWALFIATDRLIFVQAGLKRLLEDVYFVVGLLLVVRMVFKLIDLADDWARRRMTRAGREGELERVNVLFSRVAQILTASVAVIILLAHFGVNVTALSTALGVGGLAFTLAAQDSIADAVAGVIILVDRPFRVGDRIEIQGIGTWGDVQDIGLRSTRIRTRDNRVIILPNSTIGSNQVINYSYPEPSYRCETQLSVEGDADLETARRLIVDSVRSVPDVAADRPIDALYIDMRSTGITFRVRWWIEDYWLRYRNIDQVHTALQVAFARAGIPFACPTRDVKLQADLETVRRVAATFKKRGGPNPGEQTDA